MGSLGKNGRLRNSAKRYGTWQEDKYERGRKPKIRNSSGGILKCLQPNLGRAEEWSENSILVPHHSKRMRTAGQKGNFE